MKVTLEYEDEKSRKFWEIEVSGRKHTVRFGKIGTTGQSKVKQFSSKDAARADADKLIAAKKKKGYMTPGQGPTRNEAEPSAQRKPFAGEPLLDKQALLHAVNGKEVAMHVALSRKFARTTRAGFKSFNLKAFQRKIKQLPDRTLLLDVLSDDRELEAEARAAKIGDYFDFRNYFEASLIAECLPPVKKADATKTKTLKVEDTRFYPGDLEVGRLELDRDAYLIVMGTLRVKNRLALNSASFTLGLLVFGDLQIEGDLTSMDGGRIFAAGNARVDGIMSLSAHMLIKGNLNVGIMLHGDVGASYTEGSFDARLVIPHDQFTFYVGGKARAEVAVNMEDSFRKPPFKSTPIKKTVPALDKILDWRKLGINRRELLDDLEWEWDQDDLMDFADELAMAMLDIVYSPRKRGKDILLNR